MAEQRKKEDLQQPTRTFAPRKNLQHPDVTLDHQSDAAVDVPETRAALLDDTDPKHGDPNPGTIGPYRLVTCLGEGGMGSVWIAEQTEPVKRQVALKLIKSGIGSREILARFESERRALALMDHPNIARILDAGTGPDGQPWFAMELVQGSPLTKYCDTYRLDIDERLELFCQICSGIQHAHQKGIIHRDLKPGNIVVTTIDGRPVPKVIDFGLAKAIDAAGQLTEQTAMTVIGQILGTLKYMSPEQASFEAIDIDTRTDIFALGVILYELMVGMTPLDSQSVQGEPLIRVLQRIREQDPVRPSIRLQTMRPAESSLVLERRKSDLSQMNRILVGDLDWIVLKALEKDRTRRYESANGFQQDVRRFLNHEPIEARPPSQTYRLRKFVGKNRLLVTSAGLLAAALIAGMIGTTWGLVVANRSRAQSDQRLKQIEKNNSVLAGIFEDLNIEQIQADGDPLEAQLAKRLVTAGEQLDPKSIGDPVTVALLKYQLADSLLNLGFAGQATDLFQDSLAVRETILGKDDPETLNSANGLAECLLHEGEYDRARPILLNVFESRSRILGTEHIDTLDTMSNLAETLRLQGRLAEAIPLMRIALEQKKIFLGTDHRDTLTSMNNLALSLHDSGEIESAIPIFEETIEIARKSLGLDHPTTLTAMNNLAVAYRDTNQIDRAIALYEQTFELLISKRGESHPNTLLAASNLAEAYRAADRLDEALSLYEPTLERMKVKLGERHPDTLTCMNNLADGYYGAGRFAEAIAVYEPTLEMMRAMPAEHPYLWNCMQGLAKCYWKYGSGERAIPLFEEALRWQESRLGRTDYETLASLASLGVVYRESDRVNEAIALLEEVVAMIPEFPGLIHVRQELRGAYARAGRIEDVARMLETDVAAARANFDADSKELASALTLVGFDLIGIGNHEQATEVLRESLRIRETTLPGDWRTFFTQSMLGEAIAGVGAELLESETEADSARAESLFDEAEALLIQGYEGLKSVRETIAPVSRGQRLGQAIDRLIEFGRIRKDPTAIKKWSDEKAKLLDEAVGSVDQR